MSEQWDERQRVRKFRDAGGNKMPMDEMATIDKHKVMVQDFIGRFGIRPIGRLMPEFEMFYGEIQRTAERKERYAAESARWEREAKEREDRKVARDKRIVLEREQDARKDAADAIEQARHDIERFESKIDFYENRVELLRGRVSRTKGRIDRLSDAFLEAQKGTSMYSPLRRDRKRKEADLPRYLNDLSRSRGILADLRRSLEAAREALED